MSEQSEETWTPQPVQETCDLREGEAGSRWELQFTRREKEMWWMKQRMMESISCLLEKRTNKKQKKLLSWVWEHLYELIINYSLELSPAHSISCSIWGKKKLRSELKNSFLRAYKEQETVALSNCGDDLIFLVISPLTEKLKKQYAHICNLLINV